MGYPIWAWVTTVALILLLLGVDIRVNAGRAPMSLGRAAAATAAWIAVGVLFGVVLGLARGRPVAEQYYAAYLLEKSLSIDNVFLFAVLFEVLAVPLAFRRRVLYYGVVGALLLRAGFIAAGAALLAGLDWMFYVFGAVVLAAGFRMARPGQEPDPEHNLAIRLARRTLPLTPGYEGDRFVVRRAGRTTATPLLVALVAIETTDIVFAVDSIPAVFGVSRDVFVVFASNAFAVLGLRSLYFVLAGAMDRFRYLHVGLSAILVFVGTKMLLGAVVHIPTPVSLAVIAGVLVVSALISLRTGRGARGDGPDRVPVAGGAPR